MKFLIFCFSMSLSAAAMAGQTHTVVLDEYLYTGTLVGMTEALQKKLAEKIVAACGEPGKAEMSGLAISFQRGEGAGEGPLSTQVVARGDKLVIDFPAHPKAIVTATFNCAY